MSFAEDGLLRGSEELAETVSVVGIAAEYVAAEDVAAEKIAEAEASEEPAASGKIATEDPEG